MHKLGAKSTGGRLYAGQQCMCYRHKSEGNDNNRLPLSPQKLPPYT